MERNNVEIVRSGYEMFAKREFTALPFDPEIEWIEPDIEGLWESGTHHGMQAVIKEVFRPIDEKFEDFRLECEQYLDAGDHVVVTGRFLGRAKETGHELDARFAHVWTLRDGKAVRFEGHSDTANWLRALYRVHLEQPEEARR